MPKCRDRECTGCCRGAEQEPRPGLGTGSARHPGEATLPCDIEAKLCECASEVPVPQGKHGFSLGLEPAGPATRSDTMGSPGPQPSALRLCPPEDPTATARRRETRLP